MTAKEKIWILFDSDGTLSFSLLLKDSTLTYRVTAPSKNGWNAEIIRFSPLGLRRNDQDSSHELSFISESKIKTIDETYHLLVGNHRDIHSRGREQIFTFENPSQSKLELVVRIYPDGVVFRYRFPEKSKKICTVTNECSGFNIPDSDKAWLDCLFWQDVMDMTGTLPD